MNSNQSISYRPDIDGLRALAIIIVLLFHASPKKYQSGFIGVDIFFVISGYLITSIILNDLNLNRFSIRNFYVKRIKRIFPSLILVLVSSLLFSLFFLTNEELKLLFKHIASGTFFVSNIILWKESGYFDTDSELKPLLHLWSLSIEEQFYIFWPIILTFFNRKKKSILAISTAFIILSFVLNIIFIDSNPSKTFYLIHTRAWELLVGASLASGSLNKSVLRNNMQSILGITLISAGLWLIDSKTPFPGYYAALPVIGTSLLISAGTNGIINKALALKPIVYIGLISYPLYLWHWPFLAFLRIIEAGDPSRLQKNIAIAISVVFSILTYHALEKPLKKTSGDKLVKFLLGAFLVLGLLGLTQINQLFPIFIRDEKDLTPPNTFIVADLKNKNCEINHPDFKGTFCLQSKSSSPKIILIGDSHAHSLYEGFKNHFKNESVLMLGKNACAPFLNTSSFPSREKDLCIEEMNYALNLAILSPDIEKIYLHFRANTYVGNLSQSFQTAFQTTIQKLKKSGKEIIFIHQIPELNFNPQACAKLRKFRFSQINSECRVSLQSIQTMQKRYRELLDTSSVRMVDPLSIFCDDKWCHAKKFGQILYRDKDHLNTMGSNFILKNLGI